jgi:hypothetical protein
MTKRDDQILEYLWELIQFIHRGQDFGQSEEFSVVQDEGMLIKIKSLTKINFRDSTHQDADSCDAAQAYRFDAARDSWMMPPTITR